MNVNRSRQNNDVDLIRRFANHQAQAGGWIAYSAETIRIQTQEACSIITPENALTLYNFFKFLPGIQLGIKGGILFWNILCHYLQIRLYAEYGTFPVMTGC